ncbi:MAG: DUF1499 domain-containing protein [Pseudomonadota bacterium]
MLKIILIVLLLLIAASVAFLFYQGKASANQPAPTLVNGQLPPCPDKPNCVSSTAPDTDQTHYIAPIETGELTMEAIQTLIERDGGTNIQINGNLLTATYRSGVFGFIDDLMLVKTPDHIDVRSSSRVGYSDFDANRQRVERLRAGFSS